MNGIGEIFVASSGALFQFAIVFCGTYAMLSASFSPRNRWRVHLRGRGRRRMPPWFLKLWRADLQSVALQERRVLLAGCGFGWAPEAYLAIRRSLLFALPALGAVLYLLAEGGAVSPGDGWNAIFAVSLLFGAAAFDRHGLQAFRRYRADRIRKEILAVSSQLLYYAGSRLHLHGKLMKCLFLTRHIRAEMGLMLNEWYHDADTALVRFKERLGTDEAFGFAECLRSLRLNESDEIYELLREVVREFKTKADIAKDSRKETTSYAMFVLAGIPILYTFQIFLYPWVQEASKLFEALNP